MPTAPSPWDVHPVYRDPREIPREASNRGYAGRDWDSDPSGKTGVAAPYTLKSLDRQELKERFRDRQQQGTTLQNFLKRKAIPPIDQKWTNSCWCAAATDMAQIGRAGAGLKYIPLSVASVAGPVKRFSNWRGSPAGVGGWCLEAIRYGSADGSGWVPAEFWPTADLNPKWNTAENNARRLDFQMRKWLDLPRNDWASVWTCLAYGWPVTLCHMEWQHAVIAIDGLVMPDGELAVLCRNSGAGRDRTGHSILRERFGLPDEAISFQLTNLAA